MKMTVSIQVLDCEIQDNFVSDPNVTIHDNKITRFQKLFLVFCLHGLKFMDVRRFFLVFYILNLILKIIFNQMQAEGIFNELNEIHRLS